MEVFLPNMILLFLNEFRSHFSKVGFAYFQAYMFGLVFTSGRRCITKIAESCFFLNRHLSSWERFLSEHSWDITKLSGSLVELLTKNLGSSLLIHGAYLAVVDTTFVAKILGSMLGVQKWHDHSGNPDRGSYLIGHNWGLLGLVCQYQRRFLCFILLACLIPGTLNTCQWIASEHGQIVTANFWDAVLSLVYRLELLLNGQRFRVVADAFFSNASFINPLIVRSIHVVTRLRKNSVGWEDLQNHRTGKKGRPRKKGKKFKLIDLLNYFPLQKASATLYGETVDIFYVEQILWLREVSQKVKVVVLKTLKKPMILLSTDLSLSPVQIVEIYGSRYSIELSIRELKQSFGLGDYQTYLFLAIFRFVHLVCISSCLWKLFILKSQKQEDMINTSDTTFTDQSGISFERLRRSLKAFVLERFIFSKSKENVDLQKIQQELGTLTRIAL